MNHARMVKESLIISLATLLSFPVSAWQHEHTFPDNQFSAIAFNGSGYLCLQEVSAAATSADLKTWAVSTNLSIPAEIRETGDPNDTVWLGLTGVAAIDNKFLLTLQRTVHIGQMGNMYSDENLSLTSTNGVDWKNPCDFGWDGVSSGLASFPSFILSAVFKINRSDYQQISAPGYFDFYVYDPSSNQWSCALSRAVWLDGQQRLFQDEQDAFFSFRAYTNEFPRQILCTSNGVDYRVTDGGPATSEPATAYAGQILCESQIYTPGKGWEPSPFPDLRDAKFNGNRLVGRRGSSLVYSDDFGVTWNTTSIQNLSSAKIIEADGRYVALLTMQSNDLVYTSIYSIDANPVRTVVTEIGNITTGDQHLSFPAAANSLYQLESCTNLCGDAWQSYGLPFTGTGTNVTVNIPADAAQTLFFKVKAINP